MEKRTVLDYLSKWKYLIVSISFAVSLFSFYYLTSKQEYAASVTIEYTNSESKFGYTPDGTNIDSKEIYSANIISDVISDLGLDVTIDEIRTNCEVEPIIPEEEVEKKEASYKNGEVYSYFPTKYKVTFTSDAKKEKTFSINVLNSIIDNYFEHYSEKYINKANIPANPADIVDESYDYIENADVLKNSTADMLGYLKKMTESYPDYRSSETGYTFNDLYEQYQLVNDTDIPTLYALILNHKVTKNANLLKDKYQEKQNLNNIKVNDIKENIDEIITLIEAYSEKNSSDQNYQLSIGDNEIDKNRKNVINDVYENNSNPISTYDNIIDNYIKNKDSCNLMGIENDYIDYLLDIFNVNEAITQTEVLRNITEKRIKIETELSALYDIVLKNVSELNEYLGTANISSANTAFVIEKLNIKLYVLLIFMVFIVLGILGTIVISKLFENIKDLIFTDVKTKLPNNKYCDLIISNYSNQILKDEFSFILLSISNLQDINKSKGYKIGDETLKLFADYLKATINSAGTVVYNKTNQFFVFLPDSTLERAEFFMRELKERINTDELTEHIEFVYALSETESDRVYSIRKLISNTFIKLEKVQKENGDKHAK